MGLIGRILGLGSTARAVGQTVTDVAEVFVGNRGERDAQAHAQFDAVVEQYGAEFAKVGNTRFDGFVNGLNRLPRPLLALSTFALFGYAMAAPGGFAVRMQSLALVPEPLWWLLGAIVSFYFGARELHYRRGTPEAAPARLLSWRAGAQATAPRAAATDDADAPEPPAAVRVSRASDPHYNAAIEDWRDQHS